MAEESASPDVVELRRRWFEAANRRDLDAMLSLFAPDAVWETEGLGATFEGVAAIRAFLQDWFASYEEFWSEPEEVLGLGNGVVFTVVTQRGRLVGSSGYVRHRHAVVVVWVERLIERFMNYSDVDEARAAAERLAEERG